MYFSEFEYVLYLMHCAGESTALHCVGEPNYLSLHMHCSLGNGNSKNKI